MQEQLAYSIALQKIFMVSTDDSIPYSEKMDSLIDFLSDEEKQLPGISWLITKRDSLDWFDNIEVFLEGELDIPMIPQKWSFDLSTPLEEKLEDEEFRKYYNKIQGMRKQFSRNIKKYNKHF